ncbi:hypothetical protein CSW14_02360 [Thermus scotoductus]|uniref:Uncharacterized protein n=1 Tax=Thermus scotoductus TaxID=37636 RepID=A0A430VUI2_THESC|nr:hypothetical protein CSW14_02360 [Thermus scotoductus]
MGTSLPPGPGRAFLCFPPGCGGRGPSAWRPGPGPGPPVPPGGGPLPGPGDGPFCQKPPRPSPRGPLAALMRKPTWVFFRPPGKGLELWPDLKIGAPPGPDLSAAFP